MSNISTLDNIAAGLRDTFDRSYTLPPASAGIEQTENLLVIRMAGDPYALRVGEISGLTNNNQIVPLPGRTPELLGIAGIRGGLISVYSLAALLGYPREPNQGRWLALCGNENRVGLAFGNLEGYLRIAAPLVFAARQEDAVRGHVKEVAHTANQVLAIVNIPLVMEMIANRCGGKSTSPEKR